MMESGQTYHTEPLGLALSPSAPVAIVRPITTLAATTCEDARGTGDGSARSARQQPTLWHRIPLGDDAELVISDEVYARHPDRVDWLVRWARKVFN